MAALESEGADFEQVQQQLMTMGGADDYSSGNENDQMDNIQYAQIIAGTSGIVDPDQI